MPIPIVERSQREIERMIRNRIEEMDHVKSCREVKVRAIGKRFEVDMNISLDIKLGFEDLHKLVSNVERRVKSIVPNARVTVQTEALGGGEEDLWRLVKEVAERVPGTRDVHSIHLKRLDGRIGVDFHLEMSANMTLKQAHIVSQQVEKELRAANQNIGEITIHMESASDLVSRERTGAGTAVKWYIEDTAKRFPEVKGIHGIRIRKFGDSLHVEFHCFFDPNINMKQAHEVATKLESAIRSAYPNVARIDIHEEPA